MCLSPFFSTLYGRGSWPRAACQMLKHWHRLRLWSKCLQKARRSYACVVFTCCIPLLLEIRTACSETHRTGLPKNRLCRKRPLSIFSANEKTRNSLCKLGRPTCSTDLHLLQGSFRSQACNSMHQNWHARSSEEAPGPRSVYLPLPKFFESKAPACYMNTDSCSERSRRVKGLWLASCLLTVGSGRNRSMSRGYRESCSQIIPPNCRFVEWL